MHIPPGGKPLPLPAGLPRATGRASGSSCSVLPATVSASSSKLSEPVLRSSMSRISAASALVGSEPGPRGFPERPRPGGLRAGPVGALAGSWEPLGEPDATAERCARPLPVPTREDGELPSTQSAHENRINETLIGICSVGAVTRASLRYYMEESLARQ